MKVIDLLNKMANNEEMPKNIKYKGNIYKYDDETQNYLWSRDCTYDWLLGEDITVMLNDEIEIIEEVPKKIEELEDIEECFAGVGIEYNENAPQYKINQLIRNQKNIAKAVNYLLEKESDK